MANAMTAHFSRSGASAEAAAGRRFAVLPNGEFLRIPDAVRIVVETASLQDATPRTITQTALLLVQPSLAEQWQSAAFAWLQTRHETELVREALKKLLFLYVDKTLHYLFPGETGGLRAATYSANGRIGASTAAVPLVLPIAPLTVVTNLLKMLGALLNDKYGESVSGAFDDNPYGDGDSVDSMASEAESTYEEVEPLFVFACVWAFGGVLGDNGSQAKDATSRAIFSKWWRETWERLDDATAPFPLSTDRDLQKKLVSTAKELMKPAATETEAGVAEVKDDDGFGFSDSEEEDEDVEPTQVQLIAAAHAANVEIATVFDFYCDAGSSNFVAWEKHALARIAVPPSYTARPSQQIWIPNPYSAQLLYWGSVLVAGGHHVLLAGKAGVGKTRLAHEIMKRRRNLTRDDDERTDCTTIALGRHSSSLLVQAALEMELKREPYVPTTVIGRQRGPEGGGVVFAPARGAHEMVVFIDDISIPQPDCAWSVGDARCGAGYSRRSALALVRQHIDYGFWYGRTGSDFGNVRWVDRVNYICALNSQHLRGSASAVSPRLLRHFALLAVPSPTHDMLDMVFAPFLDAMAVRLPGAMQPMVAPPNAPLLNAAMLVHSAVTKEFRQSAARPHFRWGALTQLSQIVTGMAAASESLKKKISAAVGGGDISKDENGTSEEDRLMKLWIHESERAYGDRLITEAERATLSRVMEKIARKQFPNLSTTKLFRGADENVFSNIAAAMADDPHARAAAAAAAEDDGKDGAASVASMDSDDRRRLDAIAALGPQFELKLGNYAELNPPGPAIDALCYALTSEATTTCKLLNVKVFGLAVQHVCRVVRVLMQEGGHFVLLGPEASGKRTIARLATTVCGHEMRVAREASQSAGDDGGGMGLLRNAMKTAVINDRKVVVIVQVDGDTVYGSGDGSSDGVEDGATPDWDILPHVCSLLAGRTMWSAPGLFTLAQRIDFEGAAHHQAKTQTGLSLDDLTHAVLDTFYATQLRKNFHVVVCVDAEAPGLWPTRSGRDRVRGSGVEILARFPALASSAVVDWVDAFDSPAEANQEAMLDVTARAIGDLKVMSLAYQLDAKAHTRTDVNFGPKGGEGGEEEDDSEEEEFDSVGGSDSDDDSENGDGEEHEGPLKKRIGVISQFLRHAFNTATTAASAFAQERGAAARGNEPTAAWRGRRGSTAVALPSPLPSAMERGTLKRFMFLLSSFASIARDNDLAARVREQALGRALAKIENTRTMMTALVETLDRLEMDAKNAEARVVEIADAVTEQTVVATAAKAEADRIYVSWELARKKKASIAAAVAEEMAYASDDIARLDSVCEVLLDPENLRLLGQFKTMAKPPPGVEPVFSAILVMFTSIYVKDKQLVKDGKVSNKSWSTAQTHLLSNVSQFQRNLAEFRTKTDNAEVPKLNWQELKPYLKLKEFDPDVLAPRSAAGGLLCGWVQSIAAFHAVVEAVQPARDALAAAQKDFDAATAVLDTSKVASDYESKKLKDLTTMLNSAIVERDIAVQSFEITNAKVKAAQELADNLGERDGLWKRQLEQAESERMEGEHLGKALIAASLAALGGSFNTRWRHSLLKDHWIPFLARQLTMAGAGVGISVPSDPVKSVASIVDPRECAVWHSFGLPRHVCFDRGAAIVTHALRHKQWPLIIDPERQAISWLQALTRHRLWEDDVRRNNLCKGQSELLYPLLRPKEYSSSVVADNEQGADPEGGEGANARAVKKKAKEEAARRTLRFLQIGGADGAMRLEQGASAGHSLLLLGLESHGNRLGCPRHLQELLAASSGMGAPSSGATGEHATTTTNLKVTPDTVIMLYTRLDQPEIPRTLLAECVVVRFKSPATDLDAQLSSLMALHIPSAVPIIEAQLALRHAMDGLALERIDHEANLLVLISDSLTADETRVKEWKAIDAMSETEVLLSAVSASPSVLGSEHGGGLTSATTATDASTPDFGTPVSTDLVTPLPEGAEQAQTPTPTISKKVLRQKADFNALQVLTNNVSRTNDALRQLAWQHKDAAGAQETRAAKAMRATCARAAESARIVYEISCRELPRMSRAYAPSINRFVDAFTRGVKRGCLRAEIKAARDTRHLAERLAKQEEAAKEAERVAAKVAADAEAGDDPFNDAALVAAVSGGEGGDAAEDYDDEEAAHNVGTKLLDADYDIVITSERTSWVADVLYAARAPRKGRYNVLAATSAAKDAELPLVEGQDPRRNGNSVETVAEIAAENTAGGGISNGEGNLVATLVPAEVPIETIFDAKSMHDCVLEELCESYVMPSVFEHDKLAFVVLLHLRIRDLTLGRALESASEKHTQLKKLRRKLKKQRREMSAVARAQAQASGSAGVFEQVDQRMIAADNEFRTVSAEVESWSELLPILLGGAISARNSAEAKQAAGAPPDGVAQPLWEKLSNAAGLPGLESLLNSVRAKKAQWLTWLASPSATCVNMPLDDVVDEPPITLLMKASLLRTLRPDRMSAAFARLVAANAELGARYLPAPYRAMFTPPPPKVLDWYEENGHDYGGDRPMTGAAGRPGTALTFVTDVTDASGNSGGSRPTTANSDWSVGSGGGNAEQEKATVTHRYRWLQAWEQAALGVPFVEELLPRLYRQCSASTPMLFLTALERSDDDVRAWVRTLARAHNIPTQKPDGSPTTRFVEVHLGPAGGSRAQRDFAGELAAEEALEKAFESGGWVVLFSLHLARNKWIEWLWRFLERAADDGHGDFRCFVSSAAPPLRAVGAARPQDLAARAHTNARRNGGDDALRRTVATRTAAGAAASWCVVPNLLLQSAVVVAREAPTDYGSCLGRSWAVVSRVARSIAFDKRAAAAVVASKGRRRGGDSDDDSDDENAGRPKSSASRSKSKKKKSAEGESNPTVNGVLFALSCYYAALRARARFAHRDGGGSGTAFGQVTCDSALAAAALIVHEALEDGEALATVSSKGARRAESTKSSQPLAKTVPWQYLRLVVGDALIGSNITDPWDRAVHASLLEALLCPAIAFGGGALPLAAALHVEGGAATLDGDFFALGIPPLPPARLGFGAAITQKHLSLQDYTARIAQWQADDSVIDDDAVRASLPGRKEGGPASAKSKVRPGTSSSMLSTASAASARGGKKGGKGGGKGAEYRTGTTSIAAASARGAGLSHIAEHAAFGAPAAAFLSSAILPKFPTLLGSALQSFESCEQKITVSERHRTRKLKAAQDAVKKVLGALPVTSIRSPFDSLNAADELRRAQEAHDEAARARRAAEEAATERDERARDMEEDAQGGGGDSDDNPQGGDGDDGDARVEEEEERELTEREKLDIKRDEVALDARKRGEKVIYPVEELLPAFQLPLVRCCGAECARMNVLVVVVRNSLQMFLRALNGSEDMTEEFGELAEALGVSQSAMRAARDGASALDTRRTARSSIPKAWMRACANTSWAHSEEEGVLEWVRKLKLRASQLDAWALTFLSHAGQQRNEHIAEHVAHQVKVFNLQFAGEDDEEEEDDDDDAATAGSRSRPGTGATESRPNTAASVGGAGAQLSQPLILPPTLWLAGLFDPAAFVSHLMQATGCRMRAEAGAGAAVFEDLTIEMHVTDIVEHEVVGELLSGTARGGTPARGGRKGKKSKAAKRGSGPQLCGALIHGMHIRGAAWSVASSSASSGAAGGSKLDGVPCSGRLLYVAPSTPGLAPVPITTPLPVVYLRVVPQRCEGKAGEPRCVLSGFGDLQLQHQVLRSADLVHDASAPGVGAAAPRDGTLLCPVYATTARPLRIATGESDCVFTAEIASNEPVGVWARGNVALFLDKNE